MKRVAISLVLLFGASLVHADSSSSVTWLTTQQSADGSWGVPAVSFGDTQEAIDAIRLTQGPNAFYYRGIAWLENHDPANNDGQSRKLGALTDRGDPTSGALNSLAAASTASNVAPSASGWGLGGSLEASPYDTALVLRALAKQNPVPAEPGAIAYLKATYSSSFNGWELIPGGGFDITTTAQVIRALIPYQSQDSALPGILTSATNALLSAVTSSSSIKEQSLALIVAMQESPTASQITQWRSNIQAAQLSDGSWGDDPFATAIAMQAIAISGNGNSSDEFTVVNIPDPNLRAAINAILGHNAGDAITRGQLRSLTSLDASNRGITNLEGLEYATNLTSLNLSGDSVGSLSPIAGISGLTSLNVAGNPLSYWEDYDHDGFSDGAEQKYGLNPLNADSDGDGSIDGSDPFPLVVGQPANDNAPVANSFTIYATTAVTITPITTGNDTDPDSDPLQLVDLHWPAHGTLQFTPGNNSFVYTPTAGYFGSDTFMYRVTDGRGGFATANVTVVTDLPPVANADSAYARDRRRSASTISLTPAANDTDSGNSPLTIVSITQPANGTAVLQSDHLTVLYTPNPGFRGVDTLNYTISNGYGETALGTITVQVRSDSFPIKYFPVLLN